MISSRWLTRDTSSWRSSCSLCCWVDDFCQSAGQTSGPRAGKRQFTSAYKPSLKQFTCTNIYWFITLNTYIFHKKTKMHFIKLPSSIYRCCCSFAFFFHWTSSTTVSCWPSMAIMTRSSLFSSSNRRSRSCSSCLQRHQTSDQQSVCAWCVWCVWVSALTAAPGCPVCVSEHSSCSPEWTTPESASPPRRGHFLFQQEIWRTVSTQLDGLLEKIPAPESQMERHAVYVWCTCFHEASQSSLHHSSSAVDVFLLCL